MLSRGLLLTVILSWFLTKALSNVTKYRCLNTQGPQSLPTPSVILQLDLQFVSSAPLPFKQKSPAFLLLFSDIGTHILSLTFVSHFCKSCPLSSSFYLSFLFGNNFKLAESYKNKKIYRTLITLCTYSSIVNILLCMLYHFLFISPPLTFFLNHSRLS